MHVSGLQRKRYGVMDASDVPPVSELRPAIREFVQAEEDRQATLVNDLGLDEPGELGSDLAGPELLGEGGSKAIVLGAVGGQHRRSEELQAYGEILGIRK